MPGHKRTGELEHQGADGPCPRARIPAPTGSRRIAAPLAPARRQPRLPQVADAGVTMQTRINVPRTTGAEYPRRSRHLAAELAALGVNNLQCPSETTSTLPPVTLMAVWSSIAYVGAGILAAHCSAMAMSW